MSLSECEYIMFVDLKLMAVCEYPAFSMCNNMHLQVGSRPTFQMSSILAVFAQTYRPGIHCRPEIH